MKTRLFLFLSLSVLLCVQPARAQRRHRAATYGSARATLNEPAQRDGQTLPIRRVILYSNGVAYIERRGVVTGHAEINLSFKQSQVDDVLKSMVVLDLGQGRVGAVSYNSSAPPSARMADIPFSINSETRAGTSGGLAGVLAQLQGARVSVTTTQRTATGSILTVEERRAQPDSAKPAAVSHALVVVAESGELISFDLSEVRAVKLIDEGTKRDISEFASASASTRRRDAKTITVTSDGAGPREMLVSYTIAAPIWKTTYRVVLDTDGKPFFQGWAIVDNVSEEDWDNVQLSLISGTPVSFIHPIQKPFYRYRPVVPVSNNLRVSPQVYEPETGEISGNTIVGTVQDPIGASVAGAIVTVTSDATGKEYSTRTDSDGAFRTPYVSNGTYSVKVEYPGFKSTTLAGVRVTPVRPAHIGVTLEIANVSETVTVTAESSSMQTSSATVSSSKLLVDGDDTERVERQATISEAIVGGESGVKAAAEGAEVGDLFQYQIAQPVTVKRDRSALIPILQTRLEGGRVSIYSESAGRVRPMSGMLLKNISTLTLEDGALTVIDGNAYAGEALLERLKPGEQRLVSFALDLSTLVTVRNDEDSTPVHFVRISNGVLQAHYHEREKKTYVLTNQTDDKRIVYVEHPVRKDWELEVDATPRPEGKTARNYRFRVELGPRSTEQLNVVEREASLETYALSNLSSDQLAVFVRRGYVDQTTREGLQKIIELKERLAVTDARVQAIDREISEISQDQKRLRENIEALAKTSQAQQLITRYVSKADQQESRLEQLGRDKQTAVEDRRSIQAQLDAAIRSLSLDRKPDGEGLSVSR